MPVPPGQGLIQASGQSSSGPSVTPESPSRVVTASRWSCLWEEALEGKTSQRVSFLETWNQPLL